MAEQRREYTITEVAARTGLSAHTLRWYERIGMVPGVGRERNGHRRYAEEDLRRLELLTRLRSTGMPVAEMLRYSELLRQGPASYPERRRLLEAHRARVVADLDEREAMLRLLETKIARYQAEGPSGLGARPGQDGGDGAGGDETGDPDADGAAAARAATGATVETRNGTRTGTASGKGRP